MPTLCMIKEGRKGIVGGAWQRINLELGLTWCKRLTLKTIWLQSFIRKFAEQSLVGVKKKIPIAEKVWKQFRDCIYCIEDFRGK